jgi:hypothetical protein
MAVQIVPFMVVEAPKGKQYRPMPFADECRMAREFFSGVRMRPDPPFSGLVRVSAPEGITAGYTNHDVKDRTDIIIKVIEEQPAERVVFVSDAYVEALDPNAAADDPLPPRPMDSPTSVEAMIVVLITTEGVQTATFPYDIIGGEVFWKEGYAAELVEVGNDGDLDCWQQIRQALIAKQRTGAGNDESTDTEG